MDAQQLTDREREVLEALDGRTIEEAAQTLSRNVSTVKSHLKAIRRKGFRLTTRTIYSLQRLPLRG